MSAEKGAKETYSKFPEIIADLDGKIAGIQAILDKKMFRFYNLSISKKELSEDEKKFVEEVKMLTESQANFQKEKVKMEQLRDNTNEMLTNLKGTVQ